MTAVPTEAPQRADRFTATDAKITRLNLLSAGRSHEAYRDIPWDEPGHELRSDDPRPALPSSEPLTRAAWYAGLPDAERARVGAWKLACALRVGADFENLLQQALLSRTLTLPLGVPRASCSCRRRRWRGRSESAGRLFAGRTRPWKAARSWRTPVPSRASWSPRSA